MPIGQLLLALLQFNQRPQLLLLAGRQNLRSNLREILRIDRNVRL
jgi:hypothetical protein